MTNSKYETEFPTETTLFWLDRQKLVEDESILYKHLIPPITSHSTYKRLRPSFQNVFSTPNSTYKAFVNADCLKNI